jgi:hypothetical protein
VVGARFIRVTRPAELHRTALDGLKPALWPDFFDLCDLISIVRYQARRSPTPRSATVASSRQITWRR